MTKSKKAQRQDALLRLQQYHEILNGGGELSEEQIEDIESIAQDIIKTLAPLMDALKDLAEQMYKFLMEIVDKLPQETIDLITEAAQLAPDRIDPTQKEMTGTSIEITDAKSGAVIEQLTTGSIPLTPRSSLSHVNAVTALAGSAELGVARGMFS